MPQGLLPLIPEGATQINAVISVFLENGQWTYFCGTQPIFMHPKDDRGSFQMFTAQLCCQGACTQAQIIRAFGVSKKSVLRSVSKYRKEGTAGFFKPHKRGGPSVLKAEVRGRAQELLDRGHSRRDVAEQLGVAYDTLRKAINQGRLREPVSRLAVPSTGATRIAAEPEGAGTLAVSDKSTRSEQDAVAGEEMGVACARKNERVMAALGLLPEGATTQFQTFRDVSGGGLLCALPALEENGLFAHLKKLPDLSGYYTTFQVILLLAYMALSRIRVVERLQYESPGELGKLMGLDRIPEVRCLRKKLSQLSYQNAGRAWGLELSKDWMDRSPEWAGVLYVDGHVRPYHGKMTELPRRYVARQRLCLRGTTDYWVNDALGRPFFSVERPINQGLLEALSTDIVPQLLLDVPSQPSERSLEENPYLSRFSIVFDREGYSPKFFSEMWRKHRISCITYLKKAEADWPESRFAEAEVKMPNGETVEMKLAEMGTWIGSRAEGLWVREIRKLGKGGHQTSLVTTIYDRFAPETAGLLFSRWSQENFFRYMMEHYGIDALAEYRTEEIPGTNRPVVNPARRELDQCYHSLRAKLTYRQAKFASLTLHPEAEDSRMEAWERRKAELLEQIEGLEKDLGVLRERKKQKPKHISWENMPEKDRFERLAPGRKRLIDTVKMLAYRAETALAMIAREKLSHRDEGRALIRDLLRSDADIYPNQTAGILEVRLHAMTNLRFNRAIQHLLERLNEAEFVYPGTNLRFTYCMVHARVESES